MTGIRTVVGWRGGAILLALTPIALSLYLGLHNLRGSWDDGAITAAFARTYANTGRIALTPSSPTVEGMSSLVWFLLLSIPARIKPDAILITMKCLSAVSLALALGVVYRVAKEKLNSDQAAFACVLAVAWSFTGQMEIKNGMEMNLALLLTVLTYYVLSRNRFALGWVLASILLATRFESLAILFFLIIGLYLDSQRKRGLMLFGAGTLLSFMALEIWRHHIFGLWMPNTAYAKAWQPYSGWHDGTPFVTTAIVATFMVVIELLPILGVPLLLILIVRKLPPQKLPPSLWTISAGALLLAWVIGKDWGYPGRIIAVALPFLFLCVIAICQKSKLLIAILILSQAVVWAYFAIVPPHTEITIEETRSNALGAENIRKALGRTSLTVMLPDVGGTSLYGEPLQIIDSAMLTNPVLSRQGFSHFREYFQRVQPEVFETNSLWPTYQNAYTSDILNNYSIVGANGTRFFLRNDLYSKLLSTGNGTVRPVDSSPSCLRGPLANDIAYSRARKYCLLLDAGQ